MPEGVTQIMKAKEYLIFLGNEARKRHRHKTSKGRVVAFMVQLEIQHEGVWKPALRYDSAHGFSHVDRYNVAGEQRKESLNLTFDDALTFADVDINDNWEEYKNRFLEGRFP